MDTVPEDQRRLIAKDRRVGLAVLGIASFSVLTAGLAFFIAGYRQSITVIIVSSLMLLAVVFINSIFYVSPRAYFRLMAYLQPATLLQYQRQCTPQDDDPPPYRKTWVKAYRKRNIQDGDGRDTERGEDPRTSADLAMHLEGKVKAKTIKTDIIKNRKKCRNTNKLTSLSNERSDSININVLPTFEEAIKELNAGDLQKVHSDLFHGDQKSVNRPISNIEDNVRLQTDTQLTRNISEARLGRLQKHTSLCSVHSLRNYRRKATCTANIAADTSSTVLNCSNQNTINVDNPDYVTV